eukprot:263413_1
MFSRLNSQAVAKCAYCNEEFKHQHDLVAHVMESHIVSIFDGLESEGNPISTKIFSTQSPHSLTGQVKTIEQRNQLFEESFASQTDSTGQKVVHSNILLFQCNLCGQSFKRETLLANHQAIHSESDLPPFACNMCEKTFKSRGEMINHTCNNSNGRPLQCNFCVKSFKTRGELRRHYICHSDVRPFKCSLCAKTYKRSQELAVHQRSHSEDRPFPCNSCQKSFKSRFDQKTHITRIHSDSRPFQ